MLTRLLHGGLLVAAAVVFAITPSMAYPGSVPSSRIFPSASGVPATPSILTAATPGWRIVQVLPDFTTGGLTALGPRDAWLAGDACVDPQCNIDKGTVLVRHWNGKAWRAVTPPKVFIDSALDQGVGAVAATSASNAWIFAGRGNDQLAYTKALHWTGKGWAAPVRFNTGIEAAVALSATDVWAFGDPVAYPQNGFIAHFNGKTWTRGTFPITVSTVSALSATDIWAAGSTRFFAPGIERWDGHRWRAVPLPSLGFGDSNPGFIAGIAALAPRNVWADVFVPNTAPHTILLHWNGTAWKRAAFPYAGAIPSPVVSDGHGGLWLPIDTGNPPVISSWLAHDSGGHWTKIAVPSRNGDQPDVYYMSPIPGTRSMWATGDLNNSFDEALLKYGP